MFLNIVLVFVVFFGAFFAIIVTVKLREVRAASRWPSVSGVILSARSASKEDELMSDVVIVEAVRSALGRRNGGLSSMHSVDLLAAVQAELFTRSGIDPSLVGQVVGGCVGQVGMQAMNVTRNAWLTAAVWYSRVAE